MLRPSRSMTARKYLTLQRCSPSLMTMVETSLIGMKAFEAE